MADDGIPVDVPGLPGVNIDQEILRLTQLLQTSVKPRLLGVEMRPAPTHVGPPCLVVRIPRSLVGPHVVEHGKHWRFYGRNSAGKYPLDVGEVRAAFLSGQEITDRVRAFRAERLMALAADQAPVALTAADRLILHIVSAGSFESRSTVSIHMAESALMSRTLMLRGGSSTGRFTLDGCLRYSTDAGREVTASYIQIFRNGIIEVVQADVAQNSERGLLLPLAGWERLVMEMLPKYVSLLRELGVAPPLFVLLTFAGVQGAHIYTGDIQFDRGQFAMDRDLLIGPEAVIEDLSQRVDQTMAPVFDTLWQAGGYSRSPNFNDTGEYRPRR